MDLDILSDSSSWISTKALRQAADVKETLKKSFHRKSASQLPVLPTPAPLAPSALTPKNAHQRCNTISIDNFQSFSSPSAPTPQPSQKYLHQISRLNQEILILSGELKQANDQISLLSQKLIETHSKHTLHLQALQERHEQKLKRSKQEIEYLIKSSENLRNKNVERLEEESRLALEKQKEGFEEKISRQERWFCEEVRRKESEQKQQMAAFKQHFVEMIMELKNKFMEELECVESRYKSRIQLILSLQRKSTGMEADEEGSTVLDVEFDKGRMKDAVEQGDEESSSYFRDKTTRNQQRDIDFTIMQLLNQLNVSLEHSRESA